MYYNPQNPYFQSMQDQQKAFAEWQESMRKAYAQQEQFMKEQNEVMRRQFEDYRARVSANFPPMGPTAPFNQPPSYYPYYPYGMQDEKLIKVFKMIVNKSISNKEELAALASDVVNEIDPCVCISYTIDDINVYVHINRNDCSKMYTVELKGEV